MHTMNKEGNWELPDQVQTSLNYMLDGVKEKMKFELSIHAKIVISRRKIPMNWIERVISNPAKIEEDKKDKEVKHHL